MELLSIDIFHRDTGPSAPFVRGWVVSLLLKVICREDKEAPPKHLFKLLLIKRLCGKRTIPRYA